MRQSWETMTSVSAGHIILTPTQPVGSGRPQQGSNPGPPHQESRALPTELPRPRTAPKGYLLSITLQVVQFNKSCNVVYLGPKGYLETARSCLFTAPCSFHKKKKKRQTEMRFVYGETKRYSRFESPASGSSYECSVDWTIWVLPVQLAVEVLCLVQGGEINTGCLCFNVNGREFIECSQTRQSCV